MTFDIREHLDKLEPSKRKGYYHCPVCNSSNFGIQKKTGAYKCHSNECDSEEIREAIAPLDPKGDRPKKQKRSPKPKAKPVVITQLPNLAELPKGINHAPQKRIGNANQTKYWYSGDQYICRTDKEDGKTIRPYHRNENGNWKVGKGDQQWKAYRIEEACDFGKDQWIVLVEGEKCVETMRWLGYAAITFAGSSWTDKDISHAIVELKGYCKGLIIYPDNDPAGKKKAAKVLDQCAKHSYPALLLDPTHISKDLPKGGDIYDHLQESKRLGCQPADIRLDIQRAIVASFEKQAPKQKEPEPIKAKEPEPEPTEEKVKVRHNGYKNLNSMELLSFVRDEIGDGLTFDDLKSEVLLDNEPLQFGSDIKFWFLDTYGESANKEEIYDCLTYQAKQNSFNPVQQYLDQCHQQAKKVDISNISSRYFGTNDPIYDRMVEMWLVSAVARIYMPGCQVDHTLILQAGQGKYKSTWFKTLGGEWFSDSVKDIESKDSLLTMHSSWIIELSELDRITSKKQAGLIKHFLTQREDTFRKPYAKEVQRNQRRALFCGTVNPSRFLVDEENRRFWIVPIGDHIPALDIQLLEKERDGIWASAVDKLLSGSAWYPTEEEKQLIAANNKGFEETDIWQDSIADYIHGKIDVSVFEILLNLLDFEEHQMDKRNQMRVSKILTRLGWTKEARRKKAGKMRRVRVNPLHLDK